MNLNIAYNLSPNLLNETYFLDVSDVDPAFIGHIRHDLIVHPQLLIGELFSDSEKQVNLIPFSKMKEILLMKKGISIEEYRSNINNVKNNEIKSNQFSVSCLITSK
jgi:hypothetical protein